MAAIDPVQELASELRTMLRKRAVEVVDPAELPILHHILAHQSGGQDLPAPRVMNLQPLLDSSVAGIVDQETRAALEVLLGDSDLRYRSMKERGTKAASIVGVSYDAYRRAKTGRLHSDLLLLASEIASKHSGSMAIVGMATEPDFSLVPQDESFDPDRQIDLDQQIDLDRQIDLESPGDGSVDGPAAFTDPHDDPVEPAQDGLVNGRPAKRRALFALAGLVGLVVVIGGLLALARTPVDEPSAGSVQPQSTSASSVPTADSPSVTVAPAADTETASAQLSADAWAEPTCWPAGYVGADGDSDLDPDMSEAAAAMSELGAMLPEGSCMDHRVAHRGAAYWQQFSSNNRLGGGIIAFRMGQGVGTGVAADGEVVGSQDGVGEGAGQMTAVYLPLGLWQSYFRIAGGDGSRSPDMAGFPTGEVIDLSGSDAGEHFQMEVFGEITLIGEEPKGTFYWMPLVAREVWLEAEASDSPIGWPTSSVYISDGLLRIDFTDGYLEQDDQSIIRAFGVDDVVGGLGELDMLKGRIVRSLDGTGWFVDQELQRWWIPDGQTWNCVGGDGNVVLSELRGYEVHALAYGGVARCPMSADGFAPVGGGLDLGLYCHDRMGAGSEVQLVEAGWVCQGEAGIDPIDQAEACWWQYGLAAGVVVDSDDDRHWQCEQARA